MAEAEDLGILRYRLQAVEKSLGDIAVSMQALVRLEQHHSDTRDGLARAWRAIEESKAQLRQLDDQIPDKLADRLGKIEEDMPTLKLTSRWVVTFTLAGFAAAAALVWGMATDRHHDYLPPDRRSMQAEPPK